MTAPDGTSLLASSVIVDVVIWVTNPSATSDRMASGTLIIRWRGRSSGSVPTRIESHSDYPRNFLKMSVAL